jgi:hypothetical protein
MSGEIEGAQTEPRPVFSTDCKPDVVDRLKAAIPMPVGLIDLAPRAEAFVIPKVVRDDAINAIAGLRDSDARRLMMIRAVERERDEARAELEKLQQRIRALEAALAGKPGVEGAPLILYCASAAHRDEVIAAFKAINPNAYQFAVP